MHVATVFNILGRLMMVYAGVMLVPFAVALAYYGETPEMQEPWAFGIAAAVTAVVGVALRKYCTADMKKFGHREGFAIVTFSWVACALFGALPFCLIQGEGLQLSLLDGIFESVSGLTTTGSTILTDIEKYGRGILFWRAMTHWLGGMGVVVMAVAILPSLGAGGYSLLRAEVPGPTADKIAPRIAQTAKILWGVYILLTVLQIVLLWAPTWFEELPPPPQTLPMTVTEGALESTASAGNMDLYEATCHTFATLATGGFSTRNASMAAFSAYHQYVVIVFMFLAGVNFLLHYQLLIGKPHYYWRSTEWRVYTGAILVGAVLLFLGLSYLPVTADQGHPDDRLTREQNVAADLMPAVAPFEPAPEKYETIEARFRHSLFQVLSIVTTTGFATANFDAWPDFCRYLLVCFMFLGGCAGSTGGGLKVIRVIVVFKHAFSEFNRLIWPHAVTHVKIGGERVSDKVLSAIFGVFTLYLLLLVAGTLVLSLLPGFDITTAFTCAAASIGNIGPGLGKVGAVQNYAWIPDAGKFVCCILMLLGRLEIYTVLVLLVPAIYRK